MQDKQITVGLLGGSFNPPHSGHIHISEQAKNQLGLDEVWWLVTPQNPLKAKHNTKPLNERIILCHELIDSKNKAWIKVSDFEEEQKTIYTIDTLSKLISHYPQHNFVWIMGADNFLEFPKWRAWRDIFKIVPIAIFSRLVYNLRVKLCLAALSHFRFRVPYKKAGDFMKMQRLPRWIFCPCPKHPASSTELRKFGESHNSDLK